MEQGRKAMKFEHWKCEYCGDPVRENCEIVTRICLNCLESHGEEFEERWQNYMDEKYETARSNQ